MNVIAKDVKAADFDPTAWKEELLALNPWAHGLTIDKANAEFAAARQNATLARHAEGKNVWNGWANGMLALKATLESAGQWAVKPEGEEELEGENEATGVWLALAPAVFSTEVLKHHFETYVSYRWFVFPSDVRFDHATFNGKAEFSGATFSDVAEFDHATFGGEAAFVAATFGNAAVFDCANFSGEAVFLSAIFSDAQFDFATFSRGAMFWGATFSRGARFWEVTFSGEAFFKNATFGGEALLRESRFNADAYFQHAKFERPVTFASSIFRKAADFEGINSAAAFSLANATFEQVPSFFDATFKGKLRLDNVTTPRYHWFGSTPHKDATARFRELKRHAAEAQDRERELEFLAQEVRAGGFHWSLRSLLGLGFDMLSDFGRSLWRPLVSWLVLTVLCAAFFLGERDDLREARAPSSVFSTLACREPFTSTNAVNEAIQLSLKNALVFNIGSTDAARRTFGCLYGVEQVDEQRYPRIPFLVSIVSAIQTVASGLLIFLFVLAVRNLLRLK
jgi:hypothetical protein